MSVNIVVNESIILVKAIVQPLAPKSIRVVVNTSKDSIAVNELKEDLGDIDTDFTLFYNIGKL